MGRIVVLDTETTGLDPKRGDKLVEIGAVEMVNRRLTGNNYHQYIQPERDVPMEAQAVHGITEEFLADKPVFSAVADEFLAFIDGAELIIHNAPFDVGFLDNELGMLAKARGTKLPKIRDICDVTDSLIMARQKHPGQKNNLDALCRRYYIDNGHRELHGALLDSEILADVYLAMTGGQTNLLLAGDDAEAGQGNAGKQEKVSVDGSGLAIVYASSAELVAHTDKLEVVAKAAGGQAMWQEIEQGVETTI
ncbi:MAG TPA: DNA polymerase III subunit epsilon [Oceanospirillaceae bacterium]|nr:DNA polymerase III subunit epsilon [Oceanospirillaceae bacterium]